MTRSARLLALVALLALAGTSAAFGFWGTTGTGSGSAGVGTLAAPTSVTAVQSGANVNVSWTGVNAPGGGAVDGYRVTRATGTSSVQVCTTPLVTATSCIDSAVPAGEHSYAVTVVFRSWSAVSQPSAPVIVTDTTAPTALSVNRTAATVTNGTSVSWTVSFSEPVTGVTTSAFSLSPTVVGAAISSLSGSGASYTVAASTGTATTGTVQLNLSNVAGIKDAANNALAGGLSGQAYTIDKVAPTVSSMTRTSATPTNLSEVAWTVVFSEPVTGIDTDDFSLVTALTGTSISVVGSGTTYTVTAATGTGDGSLRLDVPGTATLLDAAGNGLGAAYPGGNALYTLDRTAPTVDFSVSVKTSGSNSKLELSGTAEAGRTVTVRVCRSSFPCAEGSANYVTQLTADANNRGIWSATTSNLPAGEYHLRAEQSDAAGNVGYSVVRTATI